MNLFDPVSPLRSVARFAAAALAAVTISACGGGSHAAALPQASGGAAGAAGGTVVQSTSATFTFTFPKPASSPSADRRAPKYLSSATASISLLLSDTKLHGTSTDIYANVPAAMKTVQFFNPTNLTGNPATVGQCGTDPANAGNEKCTASFLVPIGDDTVAITSYSAANGGGSVLSEQISTVWMQQAIANAFQITLDANANTMAVTASTGYCATTAALSGGQTVGAVGTSPVSFSVAYTDPASKSIAGTGLPLLKIAGSPTTGIIGAGATAVDFSINQAAQTFTLTAHSATASQAIALTATPPNSDGLSYSKSLNFTFTSGVAPPASFLADVEQNISAGGTITGGEINLFTVTLGATDTIAPYSPATLSAQPTAAGSSGSDVDYPLDVKFDANADLVIANGGTGGGDNGNFSCIPAGSLATGANTETVLTTNLAVPHQIAVGADSSVALANAQLATYDAVEYVLSGTYVAAPAYRDIARAGNFIATSVVALPASAANPSGSYAVGLQDATAKTHKVVIIHPDGSTATLMNADFAHVGLAYDAANAQLVIVSDGRYLPSGDYTKSNIQFWSVGYTPAQVKEISLTDDANGAVPPLDTDGEVAVSADGHVAVAVCDGNCYGELNVYDNTAARAKISGSLDYGAADCATDSTFTYGGSAQPENVINKLLWLSNTKLMVQLYSETTSYAHTASNGIYTYDITQTQAQPITGTSPSCDAGSGTPDGPTTIKQTGFRQLTNRPESAAYKS